MTVLLEGGVGEGKARDACGVEWVEGGIGREEGGRGTARDGGEGGRRQDDCREREDVPS